MFDHMQALPLGYFDSNQFGDIMSRYTNDADTLRQALGMTIPQAFASIVTIIAVSITMITISIPLSIVVFLCTLLMFYTLKKVGIKSTKYFINQQTSLGDLNGYIEEMIHGQKVIKVFCHEETSKEVFKIKNDFLNIQSREAFKFTNMLLPISINIGNIQYVMIAIIGGLLVLTGTANITLGAIVAFLSLSKTFTQPIGQITSQLNAIILALAGSKRIFELLDENIETDDGYVKLVNVKYQNSKLIECDEHTGIWAFKHPHGDGSITYTELKGNVKFTNVDFEYKKGFPILKNISLYANFGQKIAFVGPTGAGKTTITNLINRFYDISNGKIHFDDININKIKKSSLRRVLGIVLQDTNLFTGTIKDNILYGNLNASDEEVIAASKLANAHDFISRLPKGYDTIISGEDTNLSKGQRQLLSIARTAIADPPVMILDEATSSIDTRTESIIQKGMDSLMIGRTVFVIAHRLSTIKNSDAIMVLQQGEIIEKGNHEHLINMKGKYYQLYISSFEEE